MTDRRWSLPACDAERKGILERELNILPVTAQLLINRGLVDCDRACSFLKPDLRDLHDPMLLKDMDRAVSRVSAAIEKGERIAVWGDYDVDGTTSTALLYLFFREIGVEAVAYIPDRLTEGYGLNAEGLKKLASEGVGLIVTVDCGSSDHEQVSYASGLGMDVIVTDHHELSLGLPPAYAVVNPKRSDCGFPFKGLAGVGVAFNFLMALRARLRSTGVADQLPNLKKYLDIVSIGTVADVVPLLDENRVLVSFGLKELASSARVGLRALKEAAGIKPGAVSAGDIAYRLAPRINAAGRLRQASAAFRLLVSTDAAEAESLAAALERENRQRQAIEAEILKDAVGLVGDGYADNAIVLSSERWHPGVIGIVASRLAERFSRPVVMISIDGDVCKGSARGIRPFDMVEGLKACSGLLERFGGHRAAAGLTVARDRLEAFKKEFIGYTNKVLTVEDLTPEITLDAEVSLDEVDHRLVGEIDSLAPFGCANSEPLFCVKDAEITGAEVVGSRHLRFTVSQNGRRRAAIGFGMGGLLPIGGDGYSVAFRPYIDDWGGNRRLKLKARDIQRLADQAAAQA